MSAGDSEAETKALQDEQIVNDLFEITYYGNSLRFIKQEHVSFIRQRGANKPRLDNLQRSFLELANNSLPKERQEIVRESILAKEPFQATVDAALTNLQHKLNALIDKYMAIPKYVILPGYENEVTDVRYDAIEHNLNEKYKELELAHKQQMIMKEKIRLELLTYKSYTDDKTIDNNLIEAIQKQQDGIANDINVMGQIADKVQDFGRELNQK